MAWRFPGHDDGRDLVWSFQEGSRSSLIVFDIPVALLRFRCR